MARSTSSDDACPVASNMNQNPTEHPKHSPNLALLHRPRLLQLAEIFQSSWTERTGQLHLVVVEER